MSRQKLSDSLPLCPAGETPPRGRHVVLVPGEAAPLVTLDLPGGLRGQAREEVARRQLRDRLGGGGERVEMRPYSGLKTREGWHRALVADHGDVARWRAGAGPRAQAVLPDYLALPAAPGVWSLAARGARVLARLGPEDGFAAEAELAQLMLTRALEADPPGAVLIEGEMAWVDAACAARNIPVLTRPEEARAHDLAVPRRFAHGEGALDLRADPQAARARLRARVLPWRWPALAACLAAALWGAAQWLSVAALEEATGRARAAALAQTRAAFVPDGPVLDIRAQVSRALAEARAARSAPARGPEPMRVLARAVDVVAGQGAAPEEIDFAPDQALNLVLRVADFAAAEALVAALRDANFAVLAQEARVDEAGQGVRATLRLGVDAGEGLR